MLKVFHLAVSMSETATLPKLATIALHELLAEHSLVLWTGHLVSKMMVIMTLAEIVEL